MSKTANKTLIGAFAVGAAALLLLAVAVFGSGMLFKETARFVLFFDRSVSGLSVGSPVVFQGVPVGRVTDIRLVGTLDKLSFAAPVFIELDLENQRFMSEGNEDLERKDYLDELIRHGLRANLATQSLLTGQLMVELSFVRGGDPADAQVTEAFGVPRIPTIPSKLDSIWHKLTTLPIEQIAANILSVSQGLDRAVNGGHFQRMIAGMDELLAQVRELSVHVDATLKSVHTLADACADLADKATPGLTRALDETARTLVSVSTAAKQAEKTMLAANGIVDGNSLTVIELTRALREISDAARAVRVLANTLERNPEILLRGKGARQ